MFRNRESAGMTLAEAIAPGCRGQACHVFGLARGGTTGSRTSSEACVQVFFIRGTQMVGRDFFTLDGVQDESDGEILGSFLKQFYESAVYVPKTVVVPYAVPESALIAEWLFSFSLGAG